MKKRPIVITILAVLLMGIGVFGLVGDYLNFKSLAAEHYEILWIAGVHLLAIVAGAFILQGHNWARWLAMAWIMFHVAISFLHSVQEVMVHSIVLALFAWCLFRGPAGRYFANRQLST